MRLGHVSRHASRFDPADARVRERVIQSARNNAATILTHVPCDYKDARPIRCFRGLSGLLIPSSSLLHLFIQPDWLAHSFAANPCSVESTSADVELVFTKLSLGRRPSAAAILITTTQRERRLAIERLIGSKYLFPCVYTGLPRGFIAASALSLRV